MKKLQKSYENTGAPSQIIQKYLEKFSKYINFNFFWKFS